MVAIWVVSHYFLFLAVVDRGPWNGLSCVWWQIVIKRRKKLNFLFTGYLCEARSTVHGPRLVRNTRTTPLIAAKH